MIIPKAVLAAVVEECEEGVLFHLEACGILAGPIDRPDEVTGYHPMTNVAEYPRVRYEFDSEEQVKLWVELEELGLRPRVTYHSHLDASSDMSPTDVRMAGDPEMIHLVLSMSDREARLWRVRSGHPEQVDVPIFF